MPQTVVSALYKKSMIALLVIINLLSWKKKFVFILSSILFMSSCKDEFFVFLARPIVEILHGIRARIVRKKRYSFARIED